MSRILSKLSVRAGNIYYSTEVLRVYDLNCFQLSAIKPLGDERGEYFACVKFYASHLFPSSVLKLRLSLGAAGDGVLERLESTEKLCGRTTRRAKLRLLSRSVQRRRR